MGDWTQRVRDAVAERSEDVCEVCGMQRATHLHHRILRRFGVHTVSNGLHVDARCHLRIHNSRHATANGWIVIPPPDVPADFEVDTTDAVPRRVGAPRQRWMGEPTRRYTRTALDSPQRRRCWPRAEHPSLEVPMPAQPQALGFDSTASITLTNGPVIKSGTGTPEGAVTAPEGQRVPPHRWRRSNDALSRRPQDSGEHRVDRSD